MPRRVVGIIGGGVAGIQTAKALRAKGFSPIVFEKSNDVGGVWRENYVNFALQAPKQLFEFPDHPMTSVPAGAFPSGATVQSYIKDYFAKHKLNEVTRFNAQVTRLTRRADGKPGWTVHTVSDKASQDVDFCVVANGMYSRPHVPAYPGREAFEKTGGKVMHSSEFLQPASPTDRVVVVGCGKSAMDIALDSSKIVNAAPVNLVIRRAHWGTPRKIMGLIPFQYIFLSRFGQGLVSVHAGVWPTVKSSSALRVLNKMLSKTVTPPVFRLVEVIFAQQLGYSGVWRPSSDVVVDFYGYAQVLSPEVKKMRSKVECTLGEVDHLTAEHDVVLQSGKKIKANVLVYATGFEKDYSFLPEDDRKRLDVQPDGLHLYRQILPPNVADLAFIGSEAATISNIASHHLQAHWLARYLQGDIKPSAEDMRSEVETSRAWKRSWMPETSSRASLVLLHQIHYHDSLFSDMGMNPRRHSNALSELLMPYESRHLLVE